MNENKTVFALDIGTRSVVGIVGSVKNGNFTILDYEQEFHSKRAMRDGQIEDIELVAQVVNSVKSKLEQRSGQTFTKVSIAAAGRALRTAEGSFSYDLIPNEPISEKLIQYMEYSSIESAQEAFEAESGLEESGSDYYCVGYSVKEYLLDDYRIKNLEGQKGHKAVVNIIAAFLPASVLIGLYAATARCGLEVENLTLEPIAAIHAVVPDDVRFLNIALVDIGGGTSDIALSKDGSVVAYDMVTTAGDEITEALMQHYLTNFATAEKIKLAMGGETNIDFKDILGNQYSITPDEAFEAVKGAVTDLAEAISQRILRINGSAPAAVFLVGGGSQVRDLTRIVAEKLGMPPNRVALGIVNTENNLTLCSDDLYSPIFVTPIGIGIVSSLYRGCDFFSITVNGKRIMLFNHQTIKVIDALVLSGIKPANLIGITAPSLIYTLNGERKTIKGTPGVPGQLLVNNSPATIETEIKQGDEITAILAENGIAPEVSLYEVLAEAAFEEVAAVEINHVPVTPLDEETLRTRKINYMDDIAVFEKSPEAEAERMGISLEESSELVEEVKEKIAPAEETHHAVEINKIYSDDIEKNTVSLLLADESPRPVFTDDIQVSEPETSTAVVVNDETDSYNDEEEFEDYAGLDDVQEIPEEAVTSPLGENIALNGMDEIDVMLNGKPVHLVQEKPEEPLILMHLLKYVDLDTSAPRGNLVLQVNGEDARYATSLSNHDVVIIKWSEDM
ncbi:MAG: cell division protein FtsA [Anaerovoracaceae bacterium]